MTPIVEPVSRWDRKITPAHFLAFIGVCAAGGLCIGYGTCALLFRVLFDSSKSDQGRRTGHP